MPEQQNESMQNNDLVASLNSIFDGINSALRNPAVSDNPELSGFFQETLGKLRDHLQQSLTPASTSPSDAATTSSLNVALGLNVIFHNQADEVGSPHSRLQQFFDESYNDEEVDEVKGSMIDRGNPNWRDENAMDDAAKTLENNR